MEATVGEISLNETSVVRVRVTDFGGKFRIDIRRFFYSEDDQQFVPTTKGVTVPINEGANLVKLIQGAIDLINIINAQGGSQ